MTSVDPFSNRMSTEIQGVTEASLLRTWVWRRLNDAETLGHLPQRLARGVGRRLLGGRYLKVPYFEGELLVSPFDEVGQQIQERGVLEETISALIRSLAESGVDFVDVGANIGAHTCSFGLAARRANRAMQQIFAFEPEPRLFGVLRTNCSLNRLTNIECMNVGLAEQKGEAPLFLSPTSNRGNNSFAGQWSEGQETAICSLSTLDDELRGKIGISSPVLLKIDAEGYEQRILGGGRKILESIREALVILEIFPALLHRAGGSVRGILKVLRRAGFDDDGWIIRDGETVRADGSRSGTVYNLLFCKGQLAKDLARSRTDEQGCLLRAADAPWFASALRDERSE
jgi:FkbM family methyltransferase